MAKRLNFVSLLHIIGCFLIVFGHSIPLYVSDESNWYHNFIHTYLYSFHVPIFVFASGFLFTYTESLKKGYKNMLLKKVKRILVPYFVLNTAFVLFYFALTGNFLPKEVLNMVVCFRLAPLSHLYFLANLFLMFVISPLLDKMANSRFKYIYLAVLSILCTFRVVFTQPEIINSDFRLVVRDIIWFAACFYMGMLFAKYGNYAENKKYMSKRAMYTYLFVSVAIVFYREFFKIKAYSVIGFITTFALMVLMIAFFSALSILLSKKELWVLRFDEMTFSWYLISWPCQFIVSYLGGLFSLNAVLTGVVMFLAGVVVPPVFISIYKRIDRKNVLGFIIGI